MADEPYDFYLVTHGQLDDPFWEQVQVGLDAAASLYGVEATLVTPQRYEDGHASEVRRLLDRDDPDGLAVTMSDPAALEPPLQRAIEREGVPTVAVNVPDHRTDDERIPYQWYVGMDERVCGERLASATFGRADSVSGGLVVIHERGHQGLEQRAAGIREVFEANDVPIQVETCDRDRTLIRDRAAEFRAANPETDTIFTLGEPGTKPVFEYLGANDLLGEVNLAVVDGLVSVDGAEAYIRDGRICCSVEQDPFLQGFLSVVKLYELRDDSVPVLEPATDRRYMMGPDVVDRYNVDKELQNLLLRREFIDLLDQLDEEEKRTVIDRLNDTFQEHGGAVVVSSQIALQIVQYLV